MAMLPIGQQPAGVPRGANPGDWYCQFCKTPQFSKNIACRDCGSQRPVAGTYGTPLPATASSTALALLNASPTGQPGDWTCPQCKAICFARNPVCGRCNCPKPDGPTGANGALVPGAQVPGAAGFARGGPIVPVDTNSSWARQWNAGPVNGMFVGETELPAWLTGADLRPPEEENKTDKKKGSSDSSSSDSSGKKKTGEAKAKPKAKKKLVKKGSTKYGGLSKEEKAKKKAEEEEEKRKQMRERRKGRIISVD
eukprot:TRINITY_DN55618_c0_g1_i1.p2 TRINITY_DN55618_c0_g1~~TRINITY_DN55618_c0_g1_i1.p2  ORF type:complete len:265 (-),score=38.46 TRINITY_DN55618_c0_g1_i1:29-787(-)